MSFLKIYLFGNFEVIYNGKRINNPFWQSRQLRTIFKLLASKLGTPLPAEQITELLWPEKDPSSATKSLHVRISQLRKLLRTETGQEWIQSLSGSYVFNAPQIESKKDNSSDLWIDINQFKHSAIQGSEMLEKMEYQAAIKSLESAAELYRADYLLEDLYEEWTIPEREQLRDLYLIVLTELAEAYALNGRFRRAIQINENLLSIDPCRESSYIRQMLYYYHAGDRSKSLQVFRRCQMVLSNELNVTPLPSTIQLADQIQSGDSLRSQQDQAYPKPVYDGRLFQVPLSLSDTPLTGRDRELSWLLNTWKENSNAILSIKGEAGIGKTCLVEAFQQQLRFSGIPLLKLQGKFIDASPFGVWIDALNKYSASFNLENLAIENRDIISKLRSDQILVTGTKDNLVMESLTGTLQTAILDLFDHRLSEKMCVWIDDVHLLDNYSLDLVTRLAGKICLILTNSEMNENLQAALQIIKSNQPQLIQTIELKRWSKENVFDFFVNIGANNFETLADTLYEITQGNPFFLVTSLQHLFEEGYLFIDTQQQWQYAGAMPETLSPSIEEMIGRRLKMNSTIEQRILDVLSAAGGEINYDILQFLLEMDDEKILRHTDRLIERGILTEPRIISSAEIRFSHNLYRQVIYQSLPGPRKRSIHQQIAQAMIATGNQTPAQAADLAMHFKHGGNIKEAIQYAQKAGDFALQLYAPEKAKTHYQNGLNWLTSLNSETDINIKAHLQLQLAETFRFTGDYQKAIKLYQQAWPDLDGEYKLVALYQIYQLEVIQGKPLSSYFDLVTRIENSLQANEISWTLALLFWLQSFIFLLQGKPQEMRHYNAKGWRVARKLRDTGNIPPAWVYNRALTLLMRAHNQWGNYNTSMHFAHSNQQKFSTITTKDSNIDAVIQASLGESKYHLGKYLEARNHYQKSLKLASKANDKRLVGECLVGLSWIAFEQGGLSETETLVNRIFELNEDKKDIPRFFMASFLQAKIAMDRGVISTQITAFENISLLARYQESNPYLAKCLLLLAELYLHQHWFTQAEEFANEAVEISSVCGSKREHCAALRLSGMIMLKNGDRDKACQLIEKSLQIAHRIHTPYEIGLSLKAKAMCANKIDIALDDANQALMIFKDLGSTIEENKTRLFLEKLKIESDSPSEH